jgi:O-antigen ligase
MAKIISRHIIHRRIFYYCCILLVFLLPVYGKLIPPVIAIMVLNWLIDGRFIKTLPEIFKDPRRWWTLSFSLIYLLYLAGLLYSSNLKYGWFDVEIKLSLFIFPLLFSTLDKDTFDQPKIRIIFTMFILGCLSGSIILLSRALYSKLMYNTENSFVYSNLSWSFHPSYLSAYLTFAIAIISEFVFINYTRMSLRARAGSVTLVLFFFSMVFLLSSKAGIGSLLLVSVLYFLFVMFRKKMISSAIGLAIIFAFCFYVAFHLFPYVTVRINNANMASNFSKNSMSSDTSSTPERMAIWRSSWEIIRHNFIFGVGTGDVKDALLARYKENNFQALYAHKLNTHSQYLQTLIALGMIGLIVILAMLLLPALWALRSGNYLYLVFLFILSFNILVESMLEVQAGVVFFAFFNSFFFWTGDECKNHLTIE